MSSYGSLGSRTICKEAAERLILSIERYAMSVGELMEEGNSGEFHNKEEELRLQAEALASRVVLIGAFTHATGWVPEFVPPSLSNNFEGSWVLL